MYLFNELFLNLLYNGFRFQKLWFWFLFVVPRVLLSKRGHIIILKRRVILLVQQQPFIQSKTHHFFVTDVQSVPNKPLREGVRLTSHFIDGYVVFNAATLTHIFTCWMMMIMMMMMMIIIIVIVAFIQM